MKIDDNGVIREMTQEEINELNKQNELYEQEYYKNTSYDDLVNNEIRKKYTVSQEFAILRQKDEKPLEYKEYFDYCEQCKTNVKTLKIKYKM